MAHPHVDHGAPGGVVSGVRPGARVGVVLERQEGPVHRQQRDVRRGHQARAVGHRIVGAERHVVRVRPFVVPGDAIHQRIGEHGGGIARDEVAGEHELAHEQCVVVRVVIVGHVQLVEPAAVLRQHNRRTTHGESVVAAGDPVRGVAGNEQELGPRRSDGGRVDGTAGEEQGWEEEAAKHSTKIQRDRDTAQGRYDAGHIQRRTETTQGRYGGDSEG